MRELIDHHTILEGNPMTARMIDGTAFDSEQRAIDAMLGMYHDTLRAALATATDSLMARSTIESTTHLSYDPATRTIAVGFEVQIDPEL